ncbi:MAG: GldG family protein [Planctomycetota bacterium]
MNRLTRAIIAIVFIAAIMFSAITICQTAAKSLRIDITEQRLYNLSDGTKAILAGLNQPVTLKLYYSKTAAMKAPDQIRFFNEYYYFVEALLNEYTRQAKGMVNLQIIDPRPFSDEEAQALRYGLKRFPVTEEESFFFGLILQTQWGVEKTITFFSPDRQNFVEYDISYLIDTAITRDKKRLGILSSLKVMGDNVTGYMAQLMRMQGQQPSPPWGIVQQLKQKYDVKEIPADIEEIKDTDILLIIHPKNFSTKTQFAIDQFILKGGRAVIFLDPHCIADTPPPSQNPYESFGHKAASNLDKLLRAWGLQMPPKTFAGDRALAVSGALRPNQRPEKIIAFLKLVPPCFNKDSVISANLNQVRMLFPGVLSPLASEETDITTQLTPLLTTTDSGNSWTISSPAELAMPNYPKMLNNFVDGTEPVAMAYLATGRFKSAFPEGIDVPDESAPAADNDTDTEAAPKTKHLTGLAQAEQDCAVTIFADVDFISDAVAYRSTIFGLAVIDDNNTLMLNAVEDLAGSANLISIRSRGNFQRPFTVVDKIEAQAEIETTEEEASINAQIAGFQQELSQVLATPDKGEADIIETSILQKKKELELNIHEAQRRLRTIKNKKRERIEYLGVRLRNFCTLPGPIVTLIIAIVLGIRRVVMRRHYMDRANNA